MTALLPDPVHTSVSQDFDSTLDALQRTVEASGFVLAGHRFPWDEAGKADKPSPEKKREVQLEVLLPDAKEIRKGVALKLKSRHIGSESWRPRPEDQPGLLVFRKLCSDQGKGCDLRLMSSVNGVNGIPAKGKNLIIVAAVDHVLHFRIFDGDGKKVVDTDEKRLTEQVRQIEDLRKRLEKLWPPHDLTESE